MNMVRAGVVNHPAQWAHSGYREIQQPPERYAVIDLQGLMGLCGFTAVGDFQQAHRQWVGEGLDGEIALRDDRWSKAIAVGSLAFVDKVRSELGVKAMHREVVQSDGTYTLREESEAYGGDFASENDPLRLDNTIPWEENIESTET
jgi:putative transposase